VFYLPLALLHASVALRLAGDATASIVVLQAGAIGNGVALAVFIATMIAAVLRGRRRSPNAPAARPPPRG